MEHQQLASTFKTCVFVICLCSHSLLRAQSILPPETPWKGKSESLIVAAGNPWITPAEKSGFITTPDYNETVAWLKKLTAASPFMHLVSIGKSPEGRDIWMVIASLDKNISAGALAKSPKPLLLVQAGIHSGEIDGKDAGLMLLRDMAFSTKKSLLNQVNLLFIPILNVDGHERSSSFNRPNQRGPQNMGWRTNAQNLNLNRDYAKIDTREVRAVIAVMNTYNPIMYMDIHVTDGADYQYDITFGGHGIQGYSPRIETWLGSVYKPRADQYLKNSGHIPGTLLFAANDRDFSQGNVLVMGEPRFSDAYGNLRHLTSVLVENHSLKPYKQRVLGTYVLLESTLKILAAEGRNLKAITKADQAQREPEVPLMWKVPQMKNQATFENQSSLQKAEHVDPPDSMQMLAIKSSLKKSANTGADYVEWLGEPETFNMPVFKATEPINFVTRPEAYWVPAASQEVIERLRLHGIKMEIITQPREVSVEMYRIRGGKFQDAAGKSQPFEGHMQVTANVEAEMHEQVYAKGSARIPTDQPLGDLAMLLLEPRAPDSFFSWGFFLGIFQRTEYIEAYVMEPTIEKMLLDSPGLKLAFEEKKKSDTVFAKDPDAIFTWFYSKTKYYDSRYLLYPVGRELTR